MIGTLATDAASRQTEYRKRNRTYDEKTVTPGAVKDFEPHGWRAHVTLKSGSVKLRKERTIDEQLENRFWCCLYRLGYPELNVGRSFKIQISPDDPSLSKQIDVFARDEETVVVAECKTAEQVKRKPLQKDLHEFDSLRKPIAEALRRKYQGFRPKIIWCFVSDRIEWTDADRERAKSLRIEVITERELDYIEELSKILGGAARHQFKAEYLSGQKIPALDDVKIPAIKMRLGGKPAYVFSARADDIIRVSFVNHRDLRDPRGAPSYQRLVNPARLRKISDFLCDGGYFPNSILLNFRKKPRFDLSLKSEDKDIQFGYLYLPETYKSCWVIDGQHRLYGCAVLSDDVKAPTLMFVAFESISPTEEANLFATINREQQKVQKRLLDELDGDLKWDSEDPAERMAAIASRAIDLMNSRYGGPFEDRVISPGLKTSDDRPLTLPEVRKAVISAGLLGRVSSKDRMLTPGPCFVGSNERAMGRLIEVLTWYFDRLRMALPIRWEESKGRLCNNFGVPGHIRLLGELIRYVERDHGVEARELSPRDLFAAIEPLLEPIVRFIKESTDQEFNERFNVKLGSGGVKQYYFELVNIVHAANSKFIPPGFEDFIAETTAVEQEQADKDVRSIQERVHKFVVHKLRDVYGADFFDIAISNRDIQMRAQQKRYEDEATHRGPPEMYLDFLDLRKIVEQTENWPHFDAVLNIQLPSQRKGIAKYVKWFDEINRIRRIPAHPYKRSYTKEDLELLKLVSGHLDSTLPKGLD